jgi:hypothetical protein
MRGSLVVAGLLMVGCKPDPAYCIAEVTADQIGQGVTDPYFHNPNAVGLTICYEGTVDIGYCRDLGGIFSGDEYEDGPDGFCDDNGFTVDCNGDSNIVGVRVEPGTECPESPFTTTTAAGSDSGT